MPGLVDDAAVAKRALRGRLRLARRRRTGLETAHLARALAGVLLEMPEIRAASCVTLYASLPGEPGTGVTRQALRDRATRVLLPVVLDDLDLDWALDTGVQAPSPRGGGPEPVGVRLGLDALAQADVLLVPALAVDTLGHRLGQGGGCYDRALARARPGTPVIAVVHDDEVLDAAVEAVPVQGHDRPVDAVVTPTRWMWLSRWGG